MLEIQLPDYVCNCGSVLSHIRPEDYYCFQCREYYSVKEAKQQSSEWRLKGEVMKRWQGTGI